MIKDLFFESNKKLNLQNKKIIKTDKNMKVLKKQLTGGYLPTRDIEVQPSILGMQNRTKSNFTEKKKEVKTVNIGKINAKRQIILIFSFIKKSILKQRIQ